MSIEAWLTAVGIVVALGVGVWAIYYPRKQHDLDRGLKRGEMCIGIERSLGAVSQTGQAPQQALDAFNRATEPNRARLLFNEDGRAYINELRAKAQELWTAGMLEAIIPDEERRRPLTMKRLHLVEWMGIQESEIQRRLGCQKSIGRQ